MPVPVSREMFPDDVRSVGVVAPYVPENGPEQRPFASQSERIAEDALSLRLMPVEMIMSIRPQVPWELFPDDTLPHDPPVGVADCYPPVEELHRSLFTDPRRGRGRPMPRPSMGVAADTSGSPRNVSGPV